MAKLRQKGKNWMAGAVKHPGALTRKAKAAGESTSQFASENVDTPGQTGRQARLAKIFQRFRPK